MYLVLTCSHRATAMEHNVLLVKSNIYTTNPYKHSTTANITPPFGTKTYYMHRLSMGRLSRESKYQSAPKAHSSLSLLSFDPQC